MITVIRREILSMVRDGRFWAAGTLLTLLIFISVLVGLQDQSAKEKIKKQAGADLRQEWEGQKDKDPHAASHFGTYIIKPNGPVSWLDPGIEPYLGSALFVEAHFRNDFVHRPATDSTTLRHFGYLSPSFVLQVIAPLIIILFCFSSFAADREAGILRLLLSSGVKPITLVGGKILGSLLGLALLLLPSLLISGLILGQAAGFADLPRLMFLSLGYFLYLLTFASLTLFASALAPKSQVALSAMILVWIATCFVLPRTVSDFAAAQSPLPSKAAFADRIYEQKTKGIDGHNPQDERREALLKQTLAEYKVSRIEDLPVNFDAIALQASEDFTSELYTREFDKVAGQLESQASFVRKIAAAAPYLAIRDWSMAAAGTDFSHHKHFSDSAEAYRQNLVRQLNNDMKVNSRTGEYTYTVREDFWKTVPEFSYSPPGIGWSLKSSWPMLGLLGGWALISSLLALASAVKIKP